MRKYLASALLTLVFAIYPFVDVINQEKPVRPESAQSEQKPDANKPDVPLKVKLKPKVKLDKRCRDFVSGVVRFRVTFHETGKVTDVETVKPSSCSHFDKAAAKAASKIQFEPAMKDGRPFTLKRLVEYNFRIS